MDSESVMNSLSLPFVEALYADYLNDPMSVSADWRKYFSGLSTEDPFVQQPRIAPSFKPASLFNPGVSVSAHLEKGNGDFDGGGVSAIARAREVASLQDRVDQLVRAYRVRGHMEAQLDPLNRPRQKQPELDHHAYGLTDEDLDRTFSANTIHGPNVLTLRQILQRLRNTYCRSIGVQFMHIDSYNAKSWLQERMEGSENRLELTTEQKFRILTRLTEAVIFEEFIQKKFLGAKRFSLEGSESLIPLLDLAIEKAGEHGMNELVIGMAHRGRINVLANILKKSPELIFREFEDSDPELHIGKGDVKYHLGYHCDWITASGHSVHLALCFNPSHLEFVNPVALGRVRAKQERLNDDKREKYGLLLIHGDAAFAGEGIVQEVLNMSQLDGYSIGGTVHVIVNNQIGFTTSPEEGRSGTYATDVAKMLQSPIFHVNGEDPEAVAQVVHLAMEFRNTFKRDVFIDMYCYRRWGHNEGDEPSFTQPQLYQEIEKRVSVRDSYLQRLLSLGGVSKEEADRVAAEKRADLEKELQMVKTDDHNIHTSRPSILGRVWRNYVGGPENETSDQTDTSCETERLKWLLESLGRVPDGFNPHPKLERMFEARREMAKGERLIDWSAAEALAMATLATEGIRVRLTGQDSERGTFSHRHAVLHDYKNGTLYLPLKNIVNGQAPVDIYNSPLCEMGVLGFEYGYSIAYPDALVIWEAQFGDFCNAAQVMIDQFIVSAEDKWGSLSGVTLFLPHGFEGLGPEHSHARPERFLSMCAEDNIQVANPTTPAQLFHLMRRQGLNRWKKPLVVMTPKSLLRHPDVVSSLDELAGGRFQRILPDVLPMNKSRKVSRILLTSGKLYYELAQRRQLEKREDIAILRIEQLYPLSQELVLNALSVYSEGTPVAWAQEEPENMGAWRHILLSFGDVIRERHPFYGVTRPASASPATGSGSAHRAEQEGLISHAFDGRLDI